MMNEKLFLDPTDNRLWRNPEAVEGNPHPGWEQSMTPVQCKRICSYLTGYGPELGDTADVYEDPNGSLAILLIYQEYKDMPIEKVAAEDCRPFVWYSNRAAFGYKDIVFFLSAKGYYALECNKEGKWGAVRFNIKNEYMQNPPMLRAEKVLDCIFRTSQEAFKALKLDLKDCCRFVDARHPDCKTTKYKVTGCYTPERIDNLNYDEVFVFGSNLEGRHMGGAAMVAAEKFGAVWGVGAGLSGQSYAIPTMGGMEQMKVYVDQFLHVAGLITTDSFLVTPIGCGIAGYKPEEVAPLFKDALDMGNIRLPEAFVKILEKL